MNKASGLAATLHYQAYPFLFKASLFHSTPVLERKRRTHWDSGGYFKSSPKKFNQYYRRQRKHNLLRDVGEFAEHLFQSWKPNCDHYNEPEHSWFRPVFRESGGRRRDRMRDKTTRSFRREFEFCIDEEEHDDEFETIFRSAFGGNPYFCSFTSDDEPRSRNSSSYNNNRTRFNYYQEDDSSSENEKVTRDMASDRTALGLSKSGPLNLGDVKNAYRACALKWHPDRHQGSSKAVAEEKFKACSAAYQSLCNGLTVN